MGFSVSRKEVEHTLEWMIRSKVVAMGYLADVALFQPSNPVNKAAYDAANLAIVAGGKQIVNVFGVSSAERRAEVKVNKIFINMRQGNAGSVNLWGESLEASNLTPGTFQRSFTAISTSTLIYDIRTVTDKVEYDRICTQAVLSGLTTSRVGQAISVVLSDGTIDNSRWILVRWVNTTDIKQPQFLERLYTFEVQDVYIDDWTYDPYDDGIPPITEVIENVVIESETTIINILP